MKAKKIKDRKMFNPILKVSYLPDKESRPYSPYEVLWFKCRSMMLHRDYIMSKIYCSKDFIEGLLLELMEHFTLEEIEKLYKEKLKHSFICPCEKCERLSLDLAMDEAINTLRRQARESGDKKWAMIDKW